MDISAYFKEAIEKKASDLHLIAGSLPSVRVCGDLIKIREDVTDPKELREAVYGLLSDSLKERFERNFDVDFSHEFFGERFRINLHRQEGNIGLAARLIPGIVPRPEELGFNETIYNFTHLHDGLILVVGPTGSGKSTTLAGMLDIINQERRAHILLLSKIRLNICLRRSRALLSNAS
jgi:twitching motility protein PilT